MLCEECGQNEACVTVSVVVNDELTTRHLCSECMDKMNADLTSGNIKSLLSSILTAITGVSAHHLAENDEESSESSEEEERTDIVCPRCQTTVGHFIKTGHLGCPACYQAFREQLQPMLLQIHGRVQHAGREPLHTSEAQAFRSHQQELSRRMEEAVAREDYETAAILRDQLCAMSDSHTIL